MQNILLNFSRTGVDSVIETLHLSGDFREIKISDFFSNTMYETIVEFETRSWRFL